jgi:hypothetical protein
VGSYRILFQDSEGLYISTVSCVGGMPRTPLEAQAFGPRFYRGARLLYHENPPTSKINETPGKRVVISQVEEYHWLNLMYRILQDLVGSCEIL